MKTIISAISECAAEYEIRTGIRPENIYLGRQEWVALERWAAENALYSNAWLSAAVWRPVISGMTVYKVADEDQHMRCC